MVIGFLLDFFIDGFGCIVLFWFVFVVGLWGVVVLLFLELFLCCCGFVVILSLIKGMLLLDVLLLVLWVLVKEVVENIMIVDLVCNDFGWVVVIGIVMVFELLVV